MKFALAATIHADVRTKHAVYRRMLTSALEAVGRKSAAFITLKHSLRPPPLLLSVTTVYPPRYGMDV